MECNKRKRDLPANNKMYRYQPPKSAIWGHGLRKMPALRARNLLQEFLLSSATNYELHSASLSIDRAGDHMTGRFAELLGVPPKQFMHEDLNFDQSGACLNEVIRLEAASPTDATTIHLDQYFKVTEWTIGGQPVQTQSTLAMHYGARPLLSTRLWFQTVEQFHYIRDVMTDLGLCKLREQYLKLMNPPPEKSCLKTSAATAVPDQEQPWSIAGCQTDAK